MKDVQYVMVSKWRLHWDSLDGKWNNSTLFEMSMIFDDLYSEEWPKESKTLFIKKSKQNIFEKAWIGIAKNFRDDQYDNKPAIRLDVSELIEVECPIEFQNYECGLHKNKMYVPQKVLNIELVNNEELMPHFFKQLKTCNWEKFEKYCYYLLRLIGIHDLHAYPTEEQRGRADGFFKFSSLSVIYDATLEQNFELKKKQQIENYINQLKKETIQFEINSYTIKGTHRQVWIITRGGFVRTIKNHDHIQVKEIPYTRLIEIYNERLNNDISTDVLRDKLKDLN